MLAKHMAVCVGFRVMFDCLLVAVQRASRCSMSTRAKGEGDCEASSWQLSNALYHHETAWHWLQICMHVLAAALLEAPSRRANAPTMLAQMLAAAFIALSIFSFSRRNTGHARRDLTESRFLLSPPSVYVSWLHLIYLFLDATVACTWLAPCRQVTGETAATNPPYRYIYIN